MQPSQLPTAIDKLVALFEAALPGVRVVDGMETASDWPLEWAVVGGDGTIGEEEEAGRTQQVWMGLGAKTRDETIDVICAIGSSTGETEIGMKARRDRAYAMFTAVETALRADPGLADFARGAAVTDTALRYPNNVQGLAAVITFTISMPVRI